jgi:hypothetical protein
MYASFYYKLFYVATRQANGSLRGPLGKERIQFFVYYFPARLGDTDWLRL